MSLPPVPKRNQIICGDCVEEIQKFSADYFDTVITDPPYGLGFMGKKWDTLIEKTRDSAGGFLRNDKSGSNPYAAVRCRYGNDVNQMQQWHYQWAKECFRVAKPGAIMLVFGGTRTFHRLACAIEDAGWEIRDCMMWLTGQGFPKGHDYAYKIHQKAESKAKHDLRFVRKTYLSKAVYACRECGQVLLTCLSEQGASESWKTWAESQITRQEQSCVEGWRYFEASEGELQWCPICTMSHGILADGSEGRIHNGTPSGNGKTLRKDAETNRSSTPHRPQSEQQQDNEPYAVYLERLAQKFRGWNVGLKPAWEPIIVAMKPLDGTFAANAEKHGVAGLWIDGGRIGTNPGYKYNADKNGTIFHGQQGERILRTAKKKGQQYIESSKGRWPANLILDEEAGALLDAQSGIAKPKKGRKGKREGSGFGFFDNEKSKNKNGVWPEDNGGGASRFFAQCNYSNGDLLWNNTFVNSAEKLLWTIQVTIENSAQTSVGDWQKEKQNLFGKCAENQLNCNATLIALVLAGIKALDSNQEALQVIRDSIGNCNECTQILNLVQSVEIGENTDIIQTTINLLKLNGYVPVATKSYTPKTSQLEPTRFKYQPKASKKERGENNNHPTVKPLALMEYLCKLTKTPTGGIVLDPFGGSGTTALACKNTGRQYVIIEKEQKYVDIIKQRLE